MTRELIRSWAVCLLLVLYLQPSLTIRLPGQYGWTTSEFIRTGACLLGLLAVGYLTRWFHGSGEQSRGTP